MKRNFVFFTLFVLFMCVRSLAAEVEITADSASLYDAPNGKIVGSAQKGKKVHADERPVSGFRKLKTKSGRSLYVKESEIRDLSSGASDDLVAGDERDNHAEKKEHDFSRLTYDIGFSSGSSGHTSYSEANLGVNYFFMHWLAWRNAVFARFVSPENVYGLDSSARASYTLGGSSTSLTVFGGPGYRFVSKGDGVPFAEAGLITRLGGFTLGGGAKTFFTSAVHKGAPTDTQYFIILSGGGTL